ncbi:ankyrin repeat-containing domain protein [Dichotomocladium elegans]|nr:ankyrin repeat-containing domain protein [Dichotomocladium elegans]
MHAVELTGKSSPMPGLHNRVERPPKKFNEPLMEVVYQQRRDKVEHAQGLHLSSEDLRKFITSPAANRPRPSLDTRGKTLRLDMIESPADDANGHEEKVEATISMWQAIRNGDFAAVRQAIEDDETWSHGMLVNTRDPVTETTPLYMVAEHVRQQPEQLLELLLKHGAEPDAPSVYGVRPMHVVLINCATDLVPPIDALLAYKADINCSDGDGWTPLHYAARFLGNPDPIVRHLVNQGAQVNAVDVTNKTPLFMLLANGDHATALSWLIHTAQADLTIAGEFMFSHPTSGTVFLQSAKYGRLACMRELVRSDTAMRQLRKAISYQELNLATVILEKRLEKKNNSDNLASHIEELLELVKEFQRVLEGDPGSKVAKQIDLEKSGGRKTLRRRNALIAAVQRRRCKGMFSPDILSKSDGTFEGVEDQGKEPNLLKRLVSTTILPSLSFHRKNSSSDHQGECDRNAS